MRDSRTITWRNLISITRQPQLIVFSTIQPIIFVLMFTYVFGGAIHIGNSRAYVEYLMPGIFCQTVVFGSINTGIGLSDDLQKGLIERFRSLPMARSAVLAGRTLADLVRNVFVVLLMLIVGFAVGFRVLTSFWGLLAGIAILLLFAFSMTWIFAIVGLSASSPETAQAMSFPILAPLVFASSAFVSTSTMPGWLQVFANHQPVTAAVNATRALMIGGPDPGRRVAEPGLEHRDRGGVRPVRHPPLPPGGLTGPPDGLLRARPPPRRRRPRGPRPSGSGPRPRGGDGGVGSALPTSRSAMGHTAIGSASPHTTASGDGWVSMASAPAVTVTPALLDVADGAGQQAVAAAGQDQVGAGPDQVRVGVRGAPAAGANVACSAPTMVSTSGASSGPGSRRAGRAGTSGRR